MTKMSTSMLCTEIRAYEATNPKPESESTPSDQAKALYSNVHDQRGANNHGKNRGGGSNCGGNRGSNHGGKKGGSSHGDKKGSKRNADFDSNKYCTVHERQGHDVENCRKAASERK